MVDKVTVKIPKAEPGELVTIKKGRLGDVEGKFKKLDQLIFGIVVAIVLSMIAIIVAVVGLFLDQMRFNNAAYKEYSDKNELIIELRQANQELLKKNQQLLESSGNSTPKIAQPQQ